MRASGGKGGRRGGGGHVPSLSLLSSLPFLFYKTKHPPLSLGHLIYLSTHTHTLSHLHSQVHHLPRFKEEEEGAIAKASREKTTVVQRQVQARRIKGERVIRVESQPSSSIQKSG